MSIFVAIGLFVIVALSLLFLESTRDEPPRALASRSEFVLGTLCAVTLHANRMEARHIGRIVFPRYAPPQGVDPETALDRAFQRIRQIDELMSANRPDSEVSAISAKAGLSSVPVSDETFGILQVALEFAAKTNGVFDPTIGPLVKLWGIGTDAARLPTTLEIERARALIDWRNVAMDERSSTVFLRKKGMSLDLGAIAKGYAADEVARILSESGYTRAIIDLGGNILAMGSRKGGQSWRIGIQSPEATRGAYLGVVEVTDASVVTSGAYERFFEEGGRRYHHILDPRTGFPAEAGIVSATIVSSSSMLADGLSTSVFALGVSRGMELVEEYGFGCVLVDDEGLVHVSPSLKGSFSLIPGKYVQASP